VIVANTQRVYYTYYNISVIMVFTKEEYDMKIDTLTKRALKEASQKAILLTGMIATTLGTAVSVFAADETLFSTINTNNKTVLDEFIVFADTTILPWVVFGYFISLGLAGTNEKVVGGLKVAAKYIVGAFVGINFVYGVASFIIWIAKSLGGVA